MKNVGSLKENNTNSPKTPGGISKTLLTPCRRVGLSRNWKRSGPSPFISPLANSAERNPDKPEERKRKEKEIDGKSESPASPNVNVIFDKTLSDVIVDKTPTRNLAMPRKKKSKTLLAAITSSDTNTECKLTNLATENDEEPTIAVEIQNNPTTNIAMTEDKVTTPVRVKSKSKSKKMPSQVQSRLESNANINNCDANENHIECSKDKENAVINKSKSPNELKKECIVVIQRKIFKKEGKKLKESIENSNSKVTQDNTTSQTLFDLDSDDMPLCEVNKTGSQKLTERTTIERPKKRLETVTVNEDDDFIEHKSKIRKLDTNKSIDKQKNEKIIKKKIEPTKIVKDNSFDDDEDSDFDNKKTILIRKTYEKVNKPLKAKSTGSITQKDIDELKARIEFKKKLLLAKTITEDTKELRDLIKKWQKGCQDALMELMDLMKKKFPDKSSMDYSQILETLRIPASLVGYDSENDCFNTPDDESIILSHVNQHH